MRPGDVRGQSVWVGKAAEYKPGVEIVVREREGERTQQVRILGESESLDVDEMLDPTRHVLHLSEHASNQLAQGLWDAGVRPRDAINHEGEIRRLEAEIAFLRKLVGDFPVRPKETP